MSKRATRIVSSSTVREAIGEDSVQPEPSDSFISSPQVEQVTQRALAYLVAGYPVHFSGVAGTGKTTLAFHVASKLGRPVTLVHGDDEFGSSDLVGKDDEAQRHIAIAAPFMKNEKEYDRACFESIRGNVNGALELLGVALEKKQTTIEWIQRDLDLDFIRQDPRYHMMTSKSSQSVVGY